MKKINYILVTLMALNLNICLSQQTIDANNISSFLLGGGQRSNFATLSLQPIAIIDAEPDPSNTISFGISTNNLEAGLPATGVGGISTNDNIWLNFTYRGLNFVNAKIYVHTNQIVPAGIVIKIQVIAATNIGGSYNPNQNINPITLSTAEQLLINDFASGYTGNGLGTGYNLRITVENHSGLSLPNGFEIIYEIK
ncbi:hypothetical protein [Flavobacterium frigoris]|nr:hypothetical protein [Flavobacterium frigoris]